MVLPQDGDEFCGIAKGLLRDYPWYSMELPMRLTWGVFFSPEHR